MLAHVSSRELAEWQAFERHDGPIGNSYERMALRHIASAQGGEKDKPFPLPTEVMTRHNAAGHTFDGEFDAEIEQR